MKTCEAIGCSAPVLPYALFCDRCWPLVPSDVKRIIEKHHRPNAARRSGVLERALAHALRELLFLRTSGHHIPRDRFFEWTEDTPAPTEEQLSILEKP